MRHLSSYGVVLFLFLLLYWSTRGSLKWGLLSLLALSLLVGVLGVALGARLHRRRSSTLHALQSGHQVQDLPVSLPPSPSGVMVLADLRTLRLWRSRGLPGRSDVCTLSLVGKDAHRVALHLGWWGPVRHDVFLTDLPEVRQEVAHALSALRAQAFLEVLPDASHYDRACWAAQSGTGLFTTEGVSLLALESTSPRVLVRSWLVTGELDALEIRLPEEEDGQKDGQPHALGALDLQGVLVALDLDLLEEGVLQEKRDKEVDLVLEGPSLDLLGPHLGAQEMLPQTWGWVNLSFQQVLEKEAFLEDFVSSKNASLQWDTFEHTGGYYLLAQLLLDSDASLEDPRGVVRAFKVPQGDQRVVSSLGHLGTVARIHFTKESRSAFLLSAPRLFERLGSRLWRLLPGRS